MKSVDQLKKDRDKARIAYEAAYTWLTVTTDALRIRLKEIKEKS